MTTDNWSLYLYYSGPRFQQAWDWSDLENRYQVTSQQGHHYCLALWGFCASSKTLSTLYSLNIRNSHVRFHTDISM